MKAIILRRRKLGRTSAREVSRYAREAGFDLSEYRNDAKWPGDVDMVFRWGTTSHTQGNPVVVNTSDMIHRIANKKDSRVFLAELSMAPDTWVEPGDVPLEALEGGLHGVVVRRAAHHQGRYLHHCRTLPEVMKACALYDDYYISKYIPKVAEYRVFVCQGRAVWVAKKTPANPDAVAWNVARGGRFDNARWGDWPLKVVQLAIEAANAMEVDFAGVDVMVDAEGKAYVLELNSAPSQTSPYRQENTAKTFSYIMEHGKGHIPFVASKNYRSYIHPAICNEAVL